METVPVQQRSGISEIPTLLVTDQFSGEEIFTGIFFMDNQISDEVSQLKSVKEDMMQQPNAKEIMAMSDKLKDASIAYINEKYPQFFNELKEAAYSKNMYALESKIQESAMIIEQAGRLDPDFAEYFELGDQVQKDEALMGEISNLDLTQKEDQAKFQGLLDESKIQYKLCTPFIWCALAIFYIAVIAVTFVVALYSFWTKAAYKDVIKKEGSTSISREQMVSDLSTFFAK